MVYIKLELGWGKASKNKKQVDFLSETNGWDSVKEQVKLLTEEGKLKTASNYLTAARSFTMFIGRENWRFSEMNDSLLEKYQRWLAGRGICMNTISAYIRALRVMYHRAQGTCQQETFRKVFTGRAKTSKRSSTAEEIQQLCNLSLPEGSSLAWARDIFMFSFYAMGMPFVDIAYLKKYQVKGDFIYYARHKTGQLITVMLLPAMQKIIRKYNDPHSEYIFPILSSPSPNIPTTQQSEALHKQYCRNLRRYNYSLHRLSEKIGASRPLSSYVVRHTWASIAYQHHLDIGLIGKALGHTKTSTTLLYISNLFDRDLADANINLMKELEI